MTYRRPARIARSDEPERWTRAADHRLPVDWLPIPRPRQRQRSAEQMKSLTVILLLIVTTTCSAQSPEQTAIRYFEALENPTKKR